ncbi:MAG TPA: sugar phosphate isomerase/epimerase [candidate division Zixibacteria bacterium]|nr:sugar phosphate isomerase/epimerase [candidate division Zixibacteria bacterium]
MYYAFMSFSTPELSLEDMCGVAKEFGYDGIEPRMDADHHHGIEMATSSAERKSLKQTAEDNHIALACLATSLKYADPQKTQVTIEETHGRIDLACDLGISTMRIFGGALPGGLSREQAILTVSHALKEVADHAEEKGVTLCLETHDDWCNPSDVAEVMKRVDHPSIAVNWDIMHPVRMGHTTMSDAYQVLKPWIKHIHLHDGLGKTGERTSLTPIGEGDIDHACALNHLISDQYTGFLSGEWIKWESWKIHLPRELATLKQYEQGIINP